VVERRRWSEINAGRPQQFVFNSISAGDVAAAAALLATMISFFRPLTAPRWREIKQKRSLHEKKLVVISASGADQSTLRY